MEDSKRCIGGLLLFKLKSFHTFLQGFLKNVSFCLSKGVCCYDKTLTKGQPGEKRAYFAYIATSQFINEGSEGRHPRQETGVRN